jgi:integrase
LFVIPLFIRLLTIFNFLEFSLIFTSFGKSRELIGSKIGNKKTMATVKFRALGKNDPVNLNVRFYHNKLDLSTKSNIFVFSSDWSNKTGKVKQSVADEIKFEIEKKTRELSELVIKHFRVDFPRGINLNQDWLINIVNAYHNKPKAGVDETIYFLDFLDNYIEDSKTRVNHKTGKIISPRTIQNYTTTLRRLQEFESKKGYKLRTSEINLQFHKEFVSYLKNDGKYSNTLIEKYISQIKGFVKEAKIKGYDTSPEIESKNFTFSRDETLATYLNIKEINEIFDLDLTDSPELIDSRDMLIFGVWTGLRVGDLTRIADLNISDNRIRILETEKNNATVEIPIHPQVKEILKQRKNKLPELTSQKFNLDVKKICQKAKINETLIGSIKNPDTNRKEKDYYKKYQLISTHTCRRSFVSNHYGKIDDKTIMAITTHKSYTQYMKYVKTTLSEHADKLENYWNTNN